MLKKIRITVATLFFTLTTLLFLDFTGVLHRWFGWMAKVQLLPAILATNAAIIIALVLLTLLFGRIYCSAICPLGVFQDGISHLASSGKKNRFRHSPAKQWLRYSVLTLFIISLIAGINTVISFLDPYSAYGRIASNLFSPFYRWGNNLLAYFAERFDSYLFYPVEIWMKSRITFGICVITLLFVSILAWKNGRTYCNTICPVGTVLGWISEFSLFRPFIAKGKCTKCGLCERNCKASCIDSQNYHIDYSRCVTCMNCIDKCKFDAVIYAPRKFRVKKQKEAVDASSEVNKNDAARRSFLSAVGLAAVTGVVKAQQIHVDGGLAIIEDKRAPKRNTSLVPPGSQGTSHMKQHCTACQLCVSACPNNILRPSNKLETLMQPEMSYERGYCRPECTRCSEVCPTGAIKRITPAEKTSVSIGHAVWIQENCVVNTDEVTCTNCEYHCPTGAITRVDRAPGKNNSLKIPVVNIELCIGCGACEKLCPARPFSAIYVEGHVRHHII